MKRLFLLLMLLIGGNIGCLHFQTKPSRFKPSPHGAFLTLQGTRKRTWQIHYREQGGSAQPVALMLHGYGSSGIVWTPLMQALNKLGYRTIAPDLPGFGLTDKYPGNYNTIFIADQVAAFMTQKGVKQADILAHSWGSSVALALALRYPHKVRRIVIHSGWVYTAQIVPVIRWAKLPVLGEIIYGMFYKERPGDKFAHAVYDKERMVTQPLIETIKKSLERPGAVAAALAVARGMDFSNLEKRYSKILNKTLLLWGKQDPVALPFYGRRLVTDLPNARLVLLDRCGHIPMLEQPYLVSRYVASFLGPASQLQHNKAHNMRSHK